MSNATEQYDLNLPAENAGAAEAVSASRDPVRAPEGILAPETKQRAEDHKDDGVAEATAKPAKQKGITLPGPLGDISQSIKDWGVRWRKGAIEKTPAVVVNHSTNLIGSMQLVAEVLMFKSSGLSLIRPKIDPIDPSKNRQAIHYITDPVVKIYKGVFDKAKFEVKGNPLKLSFYKELPKNISESFAALRDLEKATLRDRTDHASMYNKWTARSGFCGICAMTIATLLPDKKDTPEETEKMTRLLKEHPVRYVGTRLYQALNPLEWFSHKREFSGLGMMFAGILSVVSGFRQIKGEFSQKMIAAGMKNTQHYMHNGWQVAGGAITTVGGAQLLLAVDNDQGWRNFGLTQMARMVTLPASIMTRFTKTEQGAGWYLGSQAVFQTKNIVAASIGGAEKDKDGNVVNHYNIRVNAKQNVSDSKAKKRGAGQSRNVAEAPVETLVSNPKEESASPAVPSPVVSQVKDVAPAMPERQGQEAVAV